MTQDEIIRMARESDRYDIDDDEVTFLERFAALVAEAKDKKLLKFLERKELEYQKRDMDGKWELCVGLIIEELREMK